MFEREQLIDHIGAYRTQSLFFETNKSKLTPILTLKRYDLEYKGVILTSLHRVYMELADPTEYAVAMEVFGSWKQWEKIINNKLLLSIIQEWRDELEVKLKSDAIRALAKTAINEGSKGTAAAKYLAERGWEKRKAGAPTKAEVKREMKVATQVSDEVTDMLKNMDLH